MNGLEIYLTGILKVWIKYPKLRPACDYYSKHASRLARHIFPQIFIVRLRKSAPFSAKICGKFALSGLVTTWIKLFAMLNNRNKQFAVLVLLFIVAPGIHFFLSGENHLVPELRSYLVGVQIALGIGLTLWFWMRDKPEK